MGKMDARVRQYLERIGYDGAAEPTKETLFALQRLHLLRVPYENMDILAGKRLSLSIDDLFHKVVTRGRGGYCFEVNALFGWLLAQMGYHVDSYFGRFVRGEPQIPMRRHHVLVARVGEERFVCDVGVGIAIAREPLLLAEGIEQTQDFGSYKLERDEVLGWVIYSREKGEWEWLYSFTEEPQLPVDFVQPTFFCEYAPESIFNKSPMIAIRTPDGRKTIDDHTFKHFSPAGVEVTELQDEAALSEALNVHFGIII